VDDGCESWSVTEKSGFVASREGVLIKEVFTVREKRCSASKKSL
jgi:hypothetical protein